MTKAYLAAAGVALISGCTQAPTIVEIRKPGERGYTAQAVQAEARRLWQFAGLSSNVYDGKWTPSGIGPTQREPMTSSANEDAALRKCKTGEEPVPVSGWGWERWSGFPSQDLRVKADKVGLFLEVWEKNAPPTIAVVFRGTEGKSWRDWLTNLRWALKWMPGWEDQYDVVRDGVRRELVAELVTRLPKWKTTPAIVATGHSLGGGLAQQLAYSLLDDNTPAGIPPISAAYAFDPSPVTGWYSVPEAHRRRNAADLKTARAFEHGEILAYLRLLFSFFYPPSSTAPEVTEIRFNFNSSWNPFSGHDIRELACDLYIRGLGQ